MSYQPCYHSLDWRCSILRNSNNHFPELMIAPFDRPHMISFFCGNYMPIFRTVSRILPLVRSKRKGSRDRGHTSFGMCFIIYRLVLATFNTSTVLASLEGLTCFSPPSGRYVMFTPTFWKFVIFNRIYTSLFTKQVAQNNKTNKYSNLKTTKLNYENLNTIYRFAKTVHCGIVLENGFFSHCVLSEVLLSTHKWFTCGCRVLTQL